MNRKRIIKTIFITTICFFLIGFIMKKTAKQYEGVNASFYAGNSGTYIQTDSGKVAGNPEAYNKFNSVGQIFYLLVTASGLAAFIVVIDTRRQNSK